VQSELIVVWVGQLDAVIQISKKGRTERDQPFGLAVGVSGHQIKALLVPSLLGFDRWTAPRDLGAAERCLDCGLLVLVPHQRPVQRVAPKQPDVPGSVAGDLAEGLGPIDVLRATFPAGTVSGAPKVRAMEIIDELEPTKRGPYAGVVGYVDFSGNLDTAIAIRTMFWRDGRATLQAGAGIVADSAPEDEDLECRNKARALLTAAAAAQRLLGGT